MRKALFITLFASLCVACTQDVADTPTIEQEASAMIINSPSGAVAGSLLVKLHNYSDSYAPEATNGLEFSARPLFPAGRATSEELQSEELYRWWIVEFDTEANIEAVAHALAKDSRLEAVEYNIEIEPIFSEPVAMESMPQTSATRAHNLPFNDEWLVDQWHYHNDGSLNYDEYDNSYAEGADINLFEAWKHTAGDRRVIIAVMDGGIKHTHQDLQDNMWVNEAEANGRSGVDDDDNGYVDDIYGYNFLDNSATIDWNEIKMSGHGTHVAGTIAAVNNNGYGVSGIAGGTGKGDGCRIMVCQIFKDGATASEANIAAAMKYAADNGAAISNNSWAYGKGAYISDSAFNRNYSVLMDGIRYFEEKGGIDGVIDGGLVLFAAGNNSYYTPSYPGAYYNHICVTAMGPNFKVGAYSNYGTGANICAPGGQRYADGCGSVHCVLSTSVSDEYEYMHGTSMATPHVSGCAALGLSYAIKLGRSFTLDEYKSLILSSVHDIDCHQTGTMYAQHNIDGWKYIDLSEYVGKLGNGYIDAHLLLMQVEGTPCLYVKADGKEHSLSLDNYFGDGASSLTFSSVAISNEDMTNLGMSSKPTIKSGDISVKCSKRGAGRISVTAIVGGTSVGGGDNMGGMEVTREFMIVARPNIASNGGWL
ncbi:MAG: S8 family serine peptidase [Alistipes sp.]|nr:S8 family serine peptidase [Alistipes sp.]